MTSKMRRIEIPEELGQVIPFECPGSERTVAVVSRAYTPEFERAIADVLKYLTENYGLRTVFTDGAVGRITGPLVRKGCKKMIAEEYKKEGKISDVEYMLAEVDYNTELIRSQVENIDGADSLLDTSDTHIPGSEDPEFYIKAAERFLRKGVISGAEYFLALGGDADIIGIEEAKLHKKSSAILRTVQDLKGTSFDKLVDSVKMMTSEVIRTEAAAVYDFDEMIRRYRDRQMRIDQYFLYLEKKAEETGIELRREFPYFYMNPWCQTRQINAFRDTFARIMNKNDDGEKADNEPELNPYQAVIQFPSSGEEWRLTRDIRSRLCENRRQRELIEADSNIELARKIIDNEGVPELVRQLEQGMEKFSSQYFSETLSHYGIELPEGFDDIDILLPEMEEFYMMAFQRASHYAGQIDHHMGESGKTSAIAVISGFCAGGVTDLLRDKKISSYNIIPKVSGHVHSKMTDKEKTEYVGKFPKPTIDQHILTDEENKAFDSLFGDIATGFTAVEHGSKGGYKRVVKLRRDKPLGLLALKIADMDIEKLRPIARGCLEERMREGGYKSFRELLEAEAMRASKLSEPIEENRNISRLLKAGSHGNLYLFLEEYAERTLKDCVEKKHPLNLDTVLYIAKALSNGLRAIHCCEGGMYHGDLKPENILVRNGAIKITDFGIASSLPDEHGLGVFNEIAAPEILIGEPHTPQSDIWSYGACIYFTRTKKFPFPKNCPEDEWKPMDYKQRGEWVFEHIYKPIMSDQHDIVMKNIDAEFNEDEFGNLAEILKTCLKRNPEERFADGFHLSIATGAIKMPAIPEPLSDLLGD